MNMNGWDMGFGGIGMILFWLLIIIGIGILTKWLAGGPSGSDSPREKTVLDVVNERYVRGEINREEFEQKKHDVGQ